MNAPARTEKTKALCVATRCTSVDQFVETFQRFCDESSFFVATLTTRPVGLETPFAIQLADRTPVLRGICVVLDAWATADNKFKRPGIRLGIKRLTPDSTATYARLREAALATSLADVDEHTGITFAGNTSVAYPANSAIARSITGGETEKTRTDDDPMAMHTAITKEGPDGNELREQATQLGRAAPARPLSVVPPPRMTPPAIPAVTPRLVTGPTDTEAWQQKRAQTNPIVGTPSPIGPRAFEQSGTTASRAPKYTDKTADNEKTAPDEPLIIIENGDPPKLPTNQAGRVELQPRGRQKPKLAPIPEPKDAVPERREDSLSIPQAPVIAAVPSGVPAMPIPREPTSALPALLRPPAAAPKSVPVIVPPSTLFDSKPVEAAPRIETRPIASKSSKPTASPAATPFGVAVIAQTADEPMAQSVPTGEIPPAGEDGRVPGSELILPANPLSNVPDESISGFIDCTLYEETANFTKTIDDNGEELDPLVPPPPVERRPRGPSIAPVAGTIPPPISATIPPAMAAAAAAANGDVGVPVAFVAVDAFGRPTTIPPWMAMPPPPAAPPPPPPPAVPTPIPGALAPPSGPISANRARARALTPGGGVAIDPVLAPRVPKRSATESEAFSAKKSKSRWLWVALPLVAAGAAAAALFATGFFDKQQADAQQIVVKQQNDVPVDAAVEPAIADAQEAVVEPDPEPKKPVKPAKPDKSKPVDPDEDEQDPTETIGDVPVVGEGPCLLTITSTPAGSSVIVDGQPIGPSPITLAGPCIRRKVDVAHPRYKLGTQWANLVASKPSSVDIRLVRPTHTLHVTTFPIGATISIGGRRAGTSPAVVQVMGYSGVTVKIEKPGFKPVSTKVYSKQPQDKLFVRLTR